MALLVNLGYEYISAADWPEFVARQQELLANRQRPIPDKGKP